MRPTDSKRASLRSSGRWPSHPLIYEINTWPWLNEIAAATGRRVTLANVPSEVWDRIAGLGFDAVWLMGVWERSPAGRRLTANLTTQNRHFAELLPDFRPADRIGSAYCVRRYEVDAALGGAAGLAEARRQLARRGVRLLLDFVPNHLAPDHPWVTDHPEYFVQGNTSDLRRDAGAFLRVQDRIFARGRDPYFPPWRDVVQVNAFQAGLRQAASEACLALADQCDGLRCDMAMLLLNEVFARTWGERAGDPPVAEFWPSVIASVKAKHPDFLWMAEVYWDLETTLLGQGFDFAYDKGWYDDVLKAEGESLRRRLAKPLPARDRLLRFLENHDEPRAAQLFGPERYQAAALMALTLPGARLMHEGQLEGRRIHLPVALARRPAETVDTDIQRFLTRLLPILRTPALSEGTWGLGEICGWPDNQSCRQVFAWHWRKEEDRWVVVVNYAPQVAQALIRLPWEDLHGQDWRLVDPMAGSDYRRTGSELASEGLYVDLPPWGWHCFRFDPA